MLTVAYETREDWLRARQSGIGASEVAALLGCDPWASRYALWASKAQVGVRGDAGESEAAEWGNRLEPLVAQKYAEVTGYRIVDHGRHAIVASDRWPHLFATLDREVFLPNGERWVLECKTTGLRYADDWAAGAPLKYVVQVQAQLAVTGLERGVLACLIGGQRFAPPVEIERNEDLIELIGERVETFWRENVELGVAPEADGSDATKRVLKTLFPDDSGETVALPGDAESWDREREEAIAQVKDGETRRDKAENALRAALGPATWGTIPGGGRYQLKVEPRAERTCPHCNGVIQEASRPRVLRRLRK